MRHLTILKNGKISLPKELIERLGLREGNGLIVETRYLSKDRWQIFITSTKIFSADEI